MDKPVEDKERLEELLIHDAKAAPTTGRLRGRGVVWAGAALVGVALLVVAWWLASGPSGIRYVTEPVTRGNLTVIVTATGSVQPTNKVDVSSELSGTVRRVLVDYNSEVKTGQVLAELDTDKLRATVNSSRAKVAAAKATVVNAEVTVTVAALDIARKKRLAAVQGVAAQDVEQAQATYDRAVAALASARADVDVAEANLQLDEINLAKASIRSPINGVVLTRNVDPGQTVASSFLAPVLFSIAEDLKAMELQVEVLLQFLVEAALFGGLIGILLGLGLALAAVRGLQVPFLFDPMIVLVAFAFSALVGIAFGYFPARRAARLDPIEALRHE